MIKALVEVLFLDQNLYNMALESHSVHLRNLIEFFNCDGNNCIDTKTLLSDPHCFSLSGEPFDSLNVKQYVNKAVDHLTEERFKWDGKGKKDLAERQKIIPVTIFEYYMATRIKAFLKMLLEPNSVKQKYQKNLINITIQKRINILLAILHNIPDVKY